jgi:hypothetical protein
MAGPIPPELLVPHPARLNPARPDYRAILDAHERAVRRGDPGYADPATGLYALTAVTLWDRGTCCGTGCRHCPWVLRQ